MKKALGKQGEEIAARYLKKLGYRVLMLNARLAGCEVDIVARQGREVVFVEVKTRTSSTFGYPEEAINAQKLAHIERAAHAWLLKHGEKPWRVDAISVEIGDFSPKITHFLGL